MTEKEEQIFLDLEGARRIRTEAIKEEQTAFQNRECPLNFPAPCSILDGSLFGEFAQIELEGKEVTPYEDVKRIVEKCQKCRVFVEDIKNILRHFP